MASDIRTIPLDRPASTPEYSPPTIASAPTTSRPRPSQGRWRRAVVARTTPSGSATTRRPPAMAAPMAAAGTSTTIASRAIGAGVRSAGKNPAAPICSRGAACRASEVAETAEQQTADRGQSGLHQGDPAKLLRRGADQPDGRRPPVAGGATEPGHQRDEDQQRHDDDRRAGQQQRGKVFVGRVRWRLHLQTPTGGDGAARRFRGGRFGATVEPQFAGAQQGRAAQWSRSPGRSTWSVGRPLRSGEQFGERGGDQQFTGRGKAFDTRRRRCRAEVLRQGRKIQPLTVIPR